MRRRCGRRRRCSRRRAGPPGGRSRSRRSQFRSPTHAVLSDRPAHSGGQVEATAPIAADACGAIDPSCATGEVRDQGHSSAVRSPRTAAAIDAQGAPTPPTPVVVGEHPGGIMSAQLRAALARAAWQAALAFVAVFFGSNLLTDATVGQVVDTTTAAAVNDAAPADEAAPINTSPDTDGERLLASLAAALGVLIARGAGEGLYDRKRNKDGSVKAGDVTPNEDTRERFVGGWVRLQGMGEKYHPVLQTESVNGNGKSRFFVAVEDH